MEITGTIKNIGTTEFVGNNGFQKRELILLTTEEYPQTILIQFTQSKCALLDTLQVGQKVKVHFNLQGREWTSPQGEVKYFNTVVGWKIELIQTTNVAQHTQQYQQAPQGYAQAPQGYTPPAQVPQQEQPQYQQGQIFNNMGQAPAQEDDGMPF